VGTGENGAKKRREKRLETREEGSCSLFWANILLEDKDGYLLVLFIVEI